MTMKEFFELYPLAAWSLVGVLGALVMVSVLWDRLRWWWTNTWYSFPLIGKISTLSRDLNRDRSGEWFKAELALCRDFKKFIAIRDEHDFNQKISYITKAGDLGRSPTPKWIWVLTCTMVFVEAMGFSYVLAGWTIPGASENLQKTGAYGIAFLVSVILVALTHLAGHELFVSRQINHARREWAEDGRKTKFTTGPIPLARLQEVDDGQPTHTMLANRVGTHSSIALTIATVVFVLIVGVFATYVRGQVLEQQLLQETTGQPLKGSSDNPYAITLPDEDVKSQQAAEAAAVATNTSIERRGGWGTFIVLAFIFLFLQILGVVFGYRWGFGGKESAAAYRALGNGRFSSYADVRADYKRIADAAQAKLETLQQRLMDRNARQGTDGMHAAHTFYEFMELEQRREMAERTQGLDDLRNHEIKLSAHAQSQPGSGSKADIPPSMPAPAPEAGTDVKRLRAEVAALEQQKQMQDEIAKLEAKLAALKGDQA